MHTRIVALVAAFILPSSSFAAPSSAPQTLGIIPSPQDSAAKSVSLADALARAEGSNPILRSALDSVAIADALTNQAGALPNPEISAVREGFQAGTRTQTVQISQKLELGGKRAARVAVAETERSVAVRDVEVAKSQLRADVTAAYFDALIAQERAVLAQASADLAAKATVAATKRVTAGRISPIERSRSRVAEAGARLELAQARSDAALSRMKLAAFWGGTDAGVLTLQQPPERSAALPALETLRSQLASSPQILRARKQVEREQAQVRLERSQRTPDLTVTLGTKRDDQIDHRQTVVGLSVPLPFFNRNEGNLLAALRRADKAANDLAGEQLRVAQALNEAYQRAQLAQSEVNVMTTEILPVAQTAYEATVTGFEAGKFSFLEVLDAQRTLFQTRAQYLRALAERYRSIADLGRYVDIAAGTPQ